MKSMKYFAGFAAGLVALVMGASQVNAITIIPPSLEFSAKPGETISTKVKLFNETTTAVELFSSTANFKAKDETGTPEFIEEQSPEDLASWVVIGAGPFVMQPGERIEIPVEIKVPTNADPGGHFAGILFSAQNPKTPVDGSSVTISSKIGSLVLVRVAGEVRESASVQQFATENGSTKFNRLPVGFMTRIQNSGNVHIRPNGSVTIRNMLGGTTAVLPVNTVQGAVLPASIRKFTADWEKAAVAKTGFFAEFGNEWRNFALGPYTATLALTYGQNNDKTLNATLHFFVFPWHVLLLVVLILAAVILAIDFGVKRYNRWIISKASSTPTQKK